METSDAPLPLAGVRVLELARILAGPWAGQTLADLGADVLKVESPDGDETRRWGPPFIDNPDGGKDAAYFHSANRGKRSVALDFKNPEDLETVKTLADGADIVIENFKVGGLEKFGLDYESLSARNPQLIYCSITGFGQTGPDAKRPGFDFIIQGMSGVMDVTGEPEGAPQKVGVAFADIFTGLYAVIGIQAALAQRARTNRGQHLDLSLLDCMVGVLANQGMNYLASGVSPDRLGNRHPNISPYEAYPTADDWFILTVGNNEQFARFCDIVGLEKLPSSPMFSSNEGRVENREELARLISAATSRWKRDDLLAALHEALVPAGPINTIEQALSNPQIVERGMVLSMTRKDDGKTIGGLRTPITASDMKLKTDAPSPRLGRDEAKWL